MEAHSPSGVAAAAHIHPDDTVAVALRALARGEKVLGVTLRQDIPAGHKFAIKDNVAGEEVIKFALPIGRALSPIKKGEWVHTHNVGSQLDGIHSYAYQPRTAPRTAIPLDRRTFMGFLREDGRAGIRNELWILPTVACVNGLAARLAREIGGQVPGGAAAFTHPYGCSQTGADLDRTRDMLIRMACHPNAGGVLVLGLGCENNLLCGFQAALGNRGGARVKYLNTQSVGNETQAGLSLLSELASVMAGDMRVPLPLDKLVVGLKCGGSDGYSGITANPLLGAFTDRLLASGGSAVLTEVPEMFGAETVLLNRANNKETYRKVLHMINHYKRYLKRQGQSLDGNPSPGNKEGGLTTLEEKSLGCVQKSGSGPIVDALPYADTVSRKGLSLLYGPGNDLCAVTALAAAGCQMILFTTGRGTPLGSPVPVVKVSASTELARQKPHWTDFDAGTLITGERMPQAAQRLAEYCLNVADGAQTCSEINGYRDFALLKDGVTL